MDPGDARASCWSASTRPSGRCCWPRPRSASSSGRLDIVRFSIVTVLLLFMLSMPIKMLGRWLFNLKYVVYIPEYFINL